MGTTLADGITTAGSPGAGTQSTVNLADICPPPDIHFTDLSQSVGEADCCLPTTNSKTIKDIFTVPEPAACSLDSDGHLFPENQITKKRKRSAEVSAYLLYFCKPTNNLLAATVEACKAGCRCRLMHFSP